MIGGSSKEGLLIRSWKLAKVVQTVLGFNMGFNNGCNPPALQQDKKAQCSCILDLVSFQKSILVAKTLKLLLLHIQIGVQGILLHSFPVERHSVKD